MKRKTVHTGNGPSPHQVQPMDTRNDDPPPSTTVGSEVQYHQSGRCLTAPSEQPTQYQQLGEGQLCHITDDPVTRADDVDVTSNPAAPRPDAHDIATPRHATPCHADGLEADAAHGPSAPRSSPSPTSASAPHAQMCGQQFAPGEPRLQQRANRSMQRAYVHAQCITGVIGPDHEVHPKVATDRRAVETVTRFRDSVLIAAAAVEVVLPNPQSTRRQFHRGPRRRRSTVRQRGGSASRRRDHGFPMGQHGPVGPNQGLPRHHVRPAASTTQVCPAASTTCHLACHPAPRTLFPHVRASIEGTSSSAAGFFRADWPRTRLMPVAPASRRRDWTSSGLRTGPHCGPWSEPNATLPPPPRDAHDPDPNKPKPGSAMSPRSHERENEAEHWQQHTTLPESQSRETSCRRSQACTLRTRTRPFH